MTRTCGSCTLCCKLLPLRGSDAKSMQAAMHMVERGFATLEEFRGMAREIQKPAGERCVHQRHTGCAIYKSRPFSCRMWNCRWLVEDDTAELARPDRSHYVIDLVPDYVTHVSEHGEQTTIPVVQIWVDPKFPEAHRDPKLRAYMVRRAREGMATLIRFNERDGLTIFPPAISADRQWHEIGGSWEAEHKPLRMTAVFEKARA